MKKIYIIGIFIGLVVLAAILVSWGAGLFRDDADLEYNQPSSSEGSSSPVIEQGGLEPAEETVLEGLDTPWEIAFLPDGQMLVAERPGRLRLVEEGKETVVMEVEGVYESEESGLAGLVLHPDFERNNWLYVYYSYRSGGDIRNRVERYTLENGGLTEKKLIIDNIPGAIYHDGGRLAFGPDGYLYITTGDARNGDLAQDKGSLAGKILRLKDDGSVPEDNPFGTVVYSYGHRNPQGLVWDNKGQLFATEHGRSGAQSGLDELNLIEAGKNYGWPQIEGDESRVGMEQPQAHSGSRATWAPADLVLWNGSLFFAGLKGEALYQAEPLGEKGKMVVTEHFSGRWGRIRALAVGPDNYLYIGTSNQDGRGKAKSGDDRLVRISPTVFKGGK